MNREEFEDAILEGVKTGKIKCILVGQTLKFIVPENVKKRHHVLSVEEALKRLQTYKPLPTLKERIKAWLKKRQKE